MKLQATEDPAEKITVYFPRIICSNALNIPANHRYPALFSPEDAGERSEKGEEQQEAAAMADALVVELSPGLEPKALTRKACASETTAVKTLPGSETYAIEDEGCEKSGPCLGLNCNDGGGGGSRGYGIEEEL